MQKSWDKATFDLLEEQLGGPCSWRGVREGGGEGWERRAGI